MPFLPVFPPGSFAMIAMAFVTASMCMLATISWLNRFFPRLRLVPADKTGFRRRAYTFIALVGLAANLLEGHVLLLEHAFIWSLILLAILFVLGGVVWMFLRFSISKPHHLPRHEQQ